MLKRLFKLQRHYASWPMLLLWLISMAVFITQMLPWATTQVTAHSHGVGPLDLEFSYSAEKAYAMLSAYGAESRAFYRLFEMTGDLIYPLVTALLLSAILKHVYQWAFPLHDDGRTTGHIITLIPFVCTMFDYSENIGIVILLSRYPEPLPALLAVTSALTSAKWISFGATVIVLFIGLARGVLRLSLKR